MECHSVSDIFADYSALYGEYFSFTALFVQEKITVILTDRLFIYKPINRTFVYIWHLVEIFWKK